MKEKRQLPPSEIFRALEAVGQILAHQGEEIGVVVVGGTALIWLGLVKRLTQDVDIIAIGSREPSGAGMTISPADPLPEPLRAAIAIVARDFGFPDTWMNSAVARQWETGLPAGFADRIRWERLGGLILGIANSRDLIFLKLYAAADDTGPQSVHFQDLIALRPTLEELQAAAQWVKTQDTSSEFASIVDKVVEYAKRDQ